MGESGVNDELRLMLISAIVIGATIILVLALLLGGAILRIRAASRAAKQRQRIHEIHQAAQFAAQAPAEVWPEIASQPHPQNAQEEERLPNRVPMPGPSALPANFTARRNADLDNQPREVMPARRRATLDNRPREVRL